MFTIGLSSITVLFAFFPRGSNYYHLNWTNEMRCIIWAWTTPAEESACQKITW